MDYRTDYATYLKIDDLLKLQQPLTPGAADELLFIVVHQSYELWFKVVIDELAKASKALQENEPWNAIAPLRRMVGIEDLLLSHLRVLETMSPEKFMEFRDPLNPASGFQSYQFRAIEFLSGVGNPAVLTHDLYTDESKAWLRSISEIPSVWDGYLNCIVKSTGVDGDDMLSALRDIYLHHTDATASALHAIAELLMDHDERIAMWRHQHMLMAGRQIGRRPGTGGSEGMAYLDSTITKRFYPLLWEVRNAL